MSYGVNLWALAKFGIQSVLSFFLWDQKTVVLKISQNPLITY